MRQHRRVKAAPNRQPTLAIQRSGRRFLAPFLGIGLTVMTMVTHPDLAHAQNLADEAPVIDVSDPNVTIDLSVLNESGLSPQVSTFKGATRPAPNAKGIQAPGARMPMSMLYIQPSRKFHLPAQTKPLRVKPLVHPRPTTRMAADAPLKPVSKLMTSKLMPSKLMPSKLMPSKLMPSKLMTSKPMAATTPPPPPIMSPPAAAMVTPPTIMTKIKTPAPIAAPTLAPVQTPPAHPKIKTVQASPSTGTAPPPPPLALPQAPAHDPQAAHALPPVPAPAPIDETQTAPTPTGSALVVDLPPQDSAERLGVASLPPTTGPLGDGDNMRIIFAQDSSKLPSGARAALKSMSERMRTQDNLRLQLLAYAGNTNTSASAARRLSLSRALAVRSFLIESGVHSTRIDVRALGNKSTDAVTERVDITVVER